MFTGLLIGLCLGFLLGLTFAIWLVQIAGYNWGLILHRWHIEIVARHYKDELEHG